MGSPADWGALGDVCGDEAASLAAEQLPREITAALDQRMVGQVVRVQVRQGRRAAAADRVVLQNAETGDQLALTVKRLGRRLAIRLLEGDTGDEVAGADCQGRLVAVTTRIDGPSGAGRLCLRLQSPELFGPFATRLPLRRRALQCVLPQLAADEVLSCLEGAWEAPPAREVLVSADEDNSSWPSMVWWPSMPADWALAAA